MRILYDFLPEKGKQDLWQDQGWRMNCLCFEVEVCF